MLWALVSERARLHGQRYLVVVLHRELGYDGLTESIAVLAGGVELAAARRGVEQEVARWVDADHGALHPVRPHEHPWPDPAPPEPVHRLRWGDGVGYNAEEIHAALFEVDPKDPLSEPFLAAIGHEEELVSWLQTIAHPPQPSR